MSEKIEYQNLLNSIVRTENRVAQLNKEFLDSGCPCCVFCWSEEARILSAKNDRRFKRKRDLEVKFGIIPKPPKSPKVQKPVVKISPLQEWFKKIV